jgi:predicted transcriptional regulator
MQEIYVINKLSTYNKKSAEAEVIKKCWITLDKVKEHLKNIIKPYYLEKGYTIEKETDSYLIMKYIELDEYESYNSSRIGVKEIILKIEKIILEK